MFTKTTRSARRFLTASAALVMAAGMAACENNSTFEDAGEEIDEGIEEVQDEIDDATDG